MVRKHNERLQAILKATIVDTPSPIPHSLQAGEDDASLFQASGALEPPYDLQTLCVLVENSNSLRQNVDSYATNIDGFGHRYEPVIDLHADDADARVAQCIALERAAAQNRGELPANAPIEPNPADVAQRKDELVRLARSERARLDAFFESCCFEHSFVELRRRTRQDLEITGNAYWEVMRNAAGNIARLVHVPAHTVRLLPLDPAATEMQESVRVSPVTHETVTTRRRLRRYVQAQGAERVYFKAFGDRRLLSKNTGQVIADSQRSRQDQMSDSPASEMMHFVIHSPLSPYGVPRWMGTLLSVLGSRQMEEVNFMYFTNKSVPPLALLVSGGRLSEGSIPRIQNFIEENLKGKNNFHKMLILEAEGAGAGDGRAKIELKPLTDAQQQDALFQRYDERNMEKVGSSFRLPALLRGDSKDFNRSVADAQLRFAEDQVFQPVRDEFDYFMNHKILADLGIRFWRFRSQAPVTRDPERLSDMVEKLVRVGVLTPEEGRVLAADVFNREFRKIGDDWTKRPITLTLAGIQNQASADIGDGSADLGQQARRLLALEQELAGEEQRLAEARMNMARDYLQGKPDAATDEVLNAADATQR